LNPAWSVIVFTVVAGAAQGLVAWFAAATLLGVRVPERVLGSGLWLAAAMLAVGLGASFLHLGRPERAWRAAAMWRTSWLSREVIVLPAFTAVVVLWAALGPAAPQAVAAVALLLALLLWWCTAMIYACLRFIQEWAHPLTVFNYTLIGLASGAVLACALGALAGEARLLRLLGPWSLTVTALAAFTRWLSLRRNARLVPRSTLQSATGITGRRVVQVSMGMTGGSFNTREFFHGRPLAWLRWVKLFFALTAFALPAALLLWGLAGASAAAFVAAAVVQAPGLLAERWFFFAQARHPQNLYYQVVS
jgi:sulfite dehydrogenase (quinone) subunit SoeC